MMRTNLNDPFDSNEEIRREDGPPGERQVRSLSDLSDDLYDYKMPPPQILPARKSEVVLREKMLKGIRSWGWTSIVLAVMHFVASGLLSPSWGITLLVIGGLSFLIRESSMFVVYAITMLWVGVENILSGGIGTWTFLGLLQLYWTYGLFRNFRFYRKVEQAYWELPEEEREPEDKADRRANRVFPMTGCAVSTVGALGGIAVFVFMVMVIAAAAQETGGMPAQELLSLIDWLWALMLTGGIIGFALGVAALLSGYPRKWMAWVGVVNGFLMIAGNYYLIYG